MDKEIPMNDDIHLNWRSQCERYTVSIAPSCFNRMLELAKKNYPCEVGTSLIGFYSDDGFNAFITDMAPLSSDSKGSGSSFYRGIKGLQTFFTKLWREHEGKRHYVGEWHSHPDALPSPSTTDDINQLAIAADLKTNCPESILIIIGGDPFDSPKLGVFVYSRKQGRIDLF
ncbi:MAG: Mov34/MPN/PAD-1 family protein [Candidatus Hodarchaeota archaeon]